jgi:hypothetical protein
VTRSEGGLTASDFTLHVGGNNALPTDFHGSEDGIIVRLAAGPYAVSRTRIGLAIAGMLM